jgi:hypothetical protein
MFFIQSCKLFRIFMILHLNKNWYRLTNLTNVTNLPKLKQISCRRNLQEKEIPFCGFGQYATAWGDIVHLLLCLYIPKYLA